MTLSLFEGFGIELEYMVVQADSLAVAPCADRLLADAAGEVTTEYENGEFAWNNELALHVIEFKTNGPRPSLTGAGAGFAGEINMANRLLAKSGRRLMPTGMHPWMDPVAELKLWDHEDKAIYNAFDRIFGCRGHGWANLQSMHINLPFNGDDQFGRLHAAVRFLLPVLPGLAASTPVMDGRLTGRLDNRLAVYRNNCARVPSVSGAVIPEPVFTIGAYHDELLAPIYRDLEPHDPQGVLREEWVNARGAIARFDRMALEIRVLDTQECPRVDLAYAAVIVATLQGLCEGAWSASDDLRDWDTAVLARYLTATIDSAEHTAIEDSRFLRALGFKGSQARVWQLWGHLAEQAARRGGLDDDMQRVLETYLERGTLASRIRRSLPAAPARADLDRVYRRLCDCLAGGESFLDAP